MGAGGRRIEAQNELLRCSHTGAEAGLFMALLAGLLPRGSRDEASGSHRGASPSRRPAPAPACGTPQAAVGGWADEGPDMRAETGPSAAWCAPHGRWKARRALLGQASEQACKDHGS